MNTAASFLLFIAVLCGSIATLLAMKQHTNVRFVDKLCYATIYFGLMSAVVSMTGA